MIGVISSGSWATALSQVLADNNHELLMWSRSKEVVEEINNRHTNSKFFDVEINHNIVATDDFNRLNEADVILLGVPTKAFEEVLNHLYEILDHEVLIINVAKGFYHEDNSRLSIVIKRILKDKCKSVVSLIGPSHAEEVIKRLLTTVNSVSDNEEDAIYIQNLFSNDYFRVYRNDDVVGAEIASAIKNIMALASGIITGLGQGDNARAGLMTRGLAEMTRFGLAMGGKMETYLGLNGVGDLIVTCSSIHSRNFQAGLKIGEADSAEEFLKNNTKTVEGIYAAKAIYELANSLNIEMPISAEVYKILYENKKPSLAIHQIMNRSLKKEQY